MDNEQLVSIWIRNEIGYISAYATIGKGLDANEFIELKLKEYPSDVENWYWDGTVLDYHATNKMTPEAMINSIPSILEQNALLLLKVTELEEKNKQLSSLSAELTMQVTKLTAEKENK